MGFDFTTLRLYDFTVLELAGFQLGRNRKWVPVNLSFYSLLGSGELTRLLPLSSFGTVLGAMKPRIILSTWARLFFFRPYSATRLLRHFSFPDAVLRLADSCLLDPDSRTCLFSINIYYCRRLSDRWPNISRQLRTSTISNRRVRLLLRIDLHLAIRLAQLCLFYHRRFFNRAARSCVCSEWGAVELWWWICMWNSKRNVGVRRTEWWSRGKWIEL